MRASPRMLTSRAVRESRTRTIRHDALRSIVFVGVLAVALESAARAQGPATLAPEELDGIEEPGAPVVFEGFVFAPDGSPAEGAVVVTSAGGKAVVDVLGHYRLEARVPREAERVQVTAVGRGGRNLVASASVGVFATAASVGVDPLSLVQGSTCTPSWLPTFGEYPGTDGFIKALAVYDDGGGPALYAGGGFTTAGGAPANRIARWDGSRWSALGSGMNATVNALAVYDDGSGPALYAGCGYSSSPAVVARWNGSSWSTVGGGFSHHVLTLAVYDDGGGPALYAGGLFANVGVKSRPGIARLVGSSWTAVGSGLHGGARALSLYDDGGGPALYAGGDFTTAGGVAANGIARWDGSSWSAVGGGMNHLVSALTVYDDGGGPSLCAGG